MTLTLRIINGADLELGASPELVLNNRGANIGRALTSEWVLPDDSCMVSRRHCEVQFRENAYYIIDYGTPNGTFVGEVERWVRDDPNMERIGDHGGVFAGNNANAVAGAVALTKIFWGGPSRPLDADEGDQIVGGLEHGLFVLQQCGTPGAPAICSQARPDFTNP
ncbi:MAG: FHA domain-containing protein [Porphyrobacter sp.]|nr:FHA domain-containing protein [Porphyrobacter sp.]